MRDKTFAMAMSKIVGEAEAERREEIEHGIRMERRARIFGRVRGIFVVLFLVTAAYFAYTYRDALANLYKPKPAPDSEGKASAALQGARQNAATRDKVIDEITQ